MPSKGIFNSSEIARNFSSEAGARSRLEGSLTCVPSFPSHAAFFSGSLVPAWIFSITCFGGSPLGTPFPSSM